MLTHQYKSIGRPLLGLSKCYGSLNPYKFQNGFNKQVPTIKGLVNRCYFGSRRPKLPEQKTSKQLVPDSKNTQKSQFLWKLNIMLNVVGIGAGFYFPNEAIMFVLTSNSLIQVYESSKLITQLKEVTEKGDKYNDEENISALTDIKTILKEIVISLGLLLASSFGIGMGFIYPKFLDYSLLGMNFWILFNLKFSNLPHGYYLVLLSLAAFQYLYFQKVFESNKKKNQGSQRI